MRRLDAPEEFYEAFATVFRRAGAGLTPADRAALWARVTLAHEARPASRAG